MRYPVHQAAAFARPAATIFRDDFTRANGNLSDNPNWSLWVGTATNVLVTSNAIQTVGTGSSDIHLCPNLGRVAVNQYVQVEYRHSTSNRGYLYLKANGVAPARYIRFRRSTNLELIVLSSEGTNTRASIVGSVSTGDIIRVEYRDGVVTIKQNGSSVGSYTLDATELAELRDNTRCGLGTAGTAQNPFIDNFEHGILA